MNSDQLPPNFRWLEEGQIAGSGLPEGPEHAAALHAAGVRAVVSFHPVSEETVALLRERGIEHLPYPITDLTSPLPASLAGYFAYLDARAFPAAGPPRPVLIH